MRQFLVLTIFLSLTVSSIYPQDISVKSFRKLQNDMDARVTAPVLDQNGDVCAIIKVVTTQSGFSFDCGLVGIVKKVQKPSEIWVYVPFGTKRISISHPQIGILRDYYFQEPLEKATVYELVLVTKIIADNPSQKLNISLSDLGIEMILVQSNELGNFYIGKTEVTQKTWMKVMLNNPSYFKNEEYPVESIGYNEIMEFLNRLNNITGLEFSLPPEECWEFAARGGIFDKSFSYSGSNTADSVAYFIENSGKSTNKVGKKKPNQLGIYDMSGNLWEYCQSNVVRGGSWLSSVNSCMIISKKTISDNSKNSTIGFRLFCLKIIQ